MRAFDLKRPRSLREAVGELPAEHDDAAPQPLAGGQDLLTVLKDDIQSPSALVDLRGIPGLDGIGRTDDGQLAIGALATIQALADDADVGAALPALRAAAASIASPQIRAHATVGGNLNQRPRCPYYRHPAVDCYKKGGSYCPTEFGFSKYAAIFGGGPSYFSHPSDLAPALQALGATVDLVGPRGPRSVPMDEFFVSPERELRTETVRMPDELVVRVRVPVVESDGRRSTYLKFKERESYDFALTAAAVVLDLEGGTIRDASVVLGAVAPLPWRSAPAEDALRGQPMNAETWRAAGEAAVADAEPLEHNGYKIHLVRGVLFRALESLA